MVRIVLLLLMIAGVLSLRPLFAASGPDAILQEAQATFRRGETKEAISLASKAVTAFPKEPKALFSRGQLYEATGKLEAAAADYRAALRLDARAADIWQRLGEVEFKRGNARESVAAFDKVLELQPTQAPHHWQRGISLYYAGKFEEGRQQFELHQTVNAKDVENAVWHYLCVAKSRGVAEARKALISTEGDRRVPMMEILRLFQEKAKPEEVLQSASRNSPAPAQLRQQLFYAHLYLGLFHDVHGNPRAAREHILKAAEEYSAKHYMGDVARVHAARFREKAE